MRALIDGDKAITERVITEAVYQKGQRLDGDIAADFRLKELRQIELD